MKRDSWSDKVVLGLQPQTTSRADVGSVWGRAAIDCWGAGLDSAGGRTHGRVLLSSLVCWKYQKEKLIKSVSFHSDLDTSFDFL